MVNLICIVVHVIRGTIKLFHPHVLPIYLSDCWKQFSTPEIQCPHTCNMARNYLQAGLVIPARLVFWIPIHLQLTISEIFDTNRYITCILCQLPYHSYRQPSRLNNGNTFHRGGGGGGGGGDKCIPRLLSMPKRFIDCQGLP